MDRYPARPYNLTMEAGGLRVAVIENDESYREFLTEKLREIEPVQEVASYESSELFWREGLKNPPDLALIDIHLPGMNGVDLATMLSLRYPELKKIVVTSLDTEERIFEAMKAGCLAYILKNELEDLENIVRIVQDGGAIITPTIALRVMKSFHRNGNNVELDENLTERELQILEQLVSGASPVRIAGLLGISVHTVRFHVKNIYRKLGVNTRPEMMRRARDLGFF